MTGCSLRCWGSGNQKKATITEALPLKTNLVDLLINAWVVTQQVRLLPRQRKARPIYAKENWTDVRKLQPLGHTTEPQLLTWYQVLGWRGESQSDPDLMLLRVSDSFPFFVPWHKWNSHPIFTLKLCRYGMNTNIMGVMGKTASIWPLTQVSLIPKNNRWKKIMGQWVGSKGKVACHQARRPEFEP